LDRFAKKAVIFDKAVSVAPWTLPAHASLMTGLYPDRHGATDYRQVLRPGISTLAGTFRASGWETVAFTDGGAVDGKFGLNAGFDRYDAWVGPEMNTAAVAIPRAGRPNDIRGERIFDRAIAFISSRDRSSRPFFLFLHTFGIHDYFKLHPWAVGKLDTERSFASSDYYLECIQGRGLCTQDDWLLVKRLYREELRHLDSSLGIFLRVLKMARLEESTLVVLVSDHGEGFEPSRDRIHHGGRLHGDQIRIPVLMASPNLHHQRVEEVVSLVDLMPTLIDFFGLSKPNDLDGRSLYPLLMGEKRSFPSRPIYMMDHYFYWQDGVRQKVPEVRRTPIQTGVIHDHDWYIQGDQGREELYDWLKDERQARNLTVSRQEAATHYRRLIEERKQIEIQFEPRIEDEDLAKTLRALGYVD
jgi:arylsulfatase A-like enzyme